MSSSGSGGSATSGEPSSGSGFPTGGSSTPGSSSTPSGSSGSSPSGSSGPGSAKSSSSVTSSTPPGCPECYFVTWEDADGTIHPDVKVTRDPNNPKGPWTGGGVTISFSDPFWTVSTPFPGFVDGPEGPCPSPGIYSSDPNPLVQVSL